VSMYRLLIWRSSVVLAAGRFEPEAAGREGSEGQRRCCRYSKALTDSLIQPMVSIYLPDSRLMLRPSSWVQSLWEKRKEEGTVSQ
jgi:hypothetical protein